MKKILLTGSHGQLADDILQVLQRNQYTVFPYTRAELDITQAHQIDSVLDDIRPDAVINTAAFTGVDLAEKESDQAYAVNRDGAKHLAIACDRLKCPLIHFSTDYVFSGTQQTPYLETDTASPINIYGSSKWQGEEAIRQHTERFIILRVSSLFGCHGQNFVKTLLRLAREREHLRIVSDQMMCPTPTAAIAETVLTLLSSFQPGLYHYAGTEPITWYDFAKEIVREASHQNKGGLKVKEIDAITTAEYPTAATRPAYSVLNCQKIKETFGIIGSDWRKGLHDVISTL